MSAIHQHKPRRHSIAQALTVAILVLLASCTSGKTAPTTTLGDPTTEVAAFATAWQSGDTAAAAQLTNDPAGSAQALEKVAADLEPTKFVVKPGVVTRTGDRTATSTATVDWTLPTAGSWTYDVTWQWIQQGTEWKLKWASSDIHPELGPQQTIVLRTTPTESGTLVDRNNAQIVSATRVFSVVALPSEMTDVNAETVTLVGILKKFDNTLEPAALAAEIGKADPDQGYTIVNLRESDFNTVQTALEGIDGISTPSTVRNLPPTRDFAKAVLGEITPVADKLTEGTEGWRIVTVDTSGAELATLKEQSAEPGKKVTLTLDVSMQTAAEQVLAGIPEPAMLVAIQPSTGEILTVAQNGAANDQGSMALQGQYPPGSIFKIVTATAGFEGSNLTPTTSVECPGTKTFDVRPVSNFEGFDLGTVDLTKAFADSCNTTFAEVAVNLPDDALNKAAKSFGIGLDFVIPGITTLTGQAPPADSVNQQAEDGFGQGVILTSVFSGALMAATVANGGMPTPTVIRGSKTTIDQEAPPLSATVASGLKTLMRAVVVDGTAKVLGPLGEVYAKTGTAEFSNEKGEIHAHAWTVGFRGDVAFAALIVGGESSSRTNDVIAKFLTALDAG